jgi:uncharacterized protein (DUF934 family)
MFTPSQPLTPLNAHRPWTHLDDITLITSAATMTTLQLANTLQRSVDAIYQRASVLGVSLKPSDPLTFTDYLWGYYN